MQEVYLLSLTKEEVRILSAFIALSSPILRVSDSQQDVADAMIVRAVILAEADTAQALHMKVAKLFASVLVRDALDRNEIAPDEWLRLLDDAEDN